MSTVPSAKRDPLWSRLSSPCSRRLLLRTVPALVTASAMSACRSERGGAPLRRSNGSDAPSGGGRLSFRPPDGPASTKGEPGPFTVPLAGGQPAVGYAPSDAGSHSLRLVLMLHGAGGVASSALELLRDSADDRRLLLVALKSVRSTWDVIAGGYGPDVENIDELLEDVSGRYRLSGYTVGGFSDGASYALSIGITNGDVFDSVIAFSPGFSAARTAHGRPRFFVSHGVADQVLPIERCSRRIVPQLREAGYDVEYREFEGGHGVPSAIRDEAAEWLAEA